MTDITTYVGIIKSLTILLYVDLRFQHAHGIANQEVERHLEMGKKMLAAGQLVDALSHYHAAIEGDPNNYLSYYRRATVFLALGKLHLALPDLDTVLKMRPDFQAARTQRASIHLKQGSIDEAAQDFVEILGHEPENEEIMEKLRKTGSLQNIKTEALDSYNDRDYDKAIELLGKLLEDCPCDLELREARSDSYIQTGDYIKAIGDIRAMTKLRPDNTDNYEQMSTLYYDMGEADESLIQVRECLKLDPDHKTCYSHYKKVKKLSKQLQTTLEQSNNGHYDDCINSALKILKIEPSIFRYRLRSYEHTCHCLSKAGDSNAAITACDEVLNMDKNNFNALCDRAEAYLTKDEFEKAINDFQSAKNINPDARRVSEGLERAQKLQKLAQKRDYYKILGVSRNAKKSVIMKAYRKLAAEWHPDKHDGSDKEMAQKKFLDIAAAKEVLTDSEKRKQYDNGEDPLDPETQANQGGPFWHQGFDPFGSGGFQFKFHF